MGFPVNNPSCLIINNSSSNKPILRTDLPSFKTELILSSNSTSVCAFLSFFACLRTLAIRFST